MPLPRRTLLALPFATPALAQPARSIRLLVGFPPSAIPDLVSRIFAPALGEALGQPVLVENRPGAGGALAAEALLRAPADGQTLMMMAQYLPVLPAVQRTVPFEVAEVLPLAGTAQAPLVLRVAPGLGVADLAGFVALAKARGEGLAYGHSGLASAPNLSMALLAESAGIAPLAVATKGEPEVLNGLLTGAVQCGFGFLAGARRAGPRRPAARPRHHHGGPRRAAGGGGELRRARPSRGADRRLVGGGRPARDAAGDPGPHCRGGDPRPRPARDPCPPAGRGLPPP